MNLSLFALLIKKSKLMILKCCSKMAWLDIGLMNSLMKSTKMLLMVNDEMQCSSSFLSFIVILKIIDTLCSIDSAITFAQMKQILAF
jgi:hypothetical protein